MSQVESLKAARAEAKGNPYREYVLNKQLAFVADPSNIAFEELELPQLIQVCGGGRAFMRGRGQGHRAREREGRGGAGGKGGPSRQREGAHAAGLLGDTIDDRQGAGEAFGCCNPCTPAVGLTCCTLPAA